MKNANLKSLAGVVVLQVGVFGAVATAASRHLPLAFEKMPDGKAYVLRGSQRQLALLPGGIAIDGSTATLQFGTGTALPTGENRQPTEVIYYVGNDPHGWFRTAQFGQVRYREVYAGIDLVFYPSERQIEYDWVVRPGADPSQARIRIQGGAEAFLDADGNLNLKTATLQLRQRRPVAYQMIEGRRREVSAAYRKLRNGEVRIDVGAYDRSHELVIDPVLQWLSYLGGSGTEVSTTIKAAPDGGAYLGFVSTSTFLYFPSTTAAPTTKSSSQYAVLAKLSKDGGTIEQLAYFGGTGTTTLNSIALDQAGNLYLGGGTNASTFPLLNAFRKQLQGAEGYILKVTSKFDLVYSSFIGGSGADEVTSVAVDNAGRAYLTGQTESTDFINIKALETKAGSGFVARVDSSGMVEYSGYTYQGLTGTRIQTDANGAAYVVLAAVPFGYPWWVANYIVKISADGSKYQYQHAFNTGDLTSAFAFHVDPNSGVANFGGFSRALQGGYVSQLDAAGNTVTTVMTIPENPTSCNLPDCGALYDFGFDSAGNLFVIGQGGWGGWKTVNGYQSFGSKNTDYSSVYVGKWNKSAGFVWSTYLQGSSSDMGRALDIASDGSVYLIGHTTSSDFPTFSSAGGYEASGGGADLWFAKIVENSDPCQYSIRSDRSSITGNGGTGSFQVVTNRPECTWTAKPEQSWLTVTSGASGQGMGQVQFRAETNLGVSRTGRVLLNSNLAHNVYQADSSCVYTLPGTRGLAWQGGHTQYSIAIQAGGGCKWTATTSESWITILQNASASGGSGTVVLRIDANPGAPRTGQMTIAGQSYQILQGGVAGPVPTITSVLNGASYLPGIQAGSWAMIQGSNLANTSPGRTWRDNEVVNGKLPTALDGVSVTINGKPAFVYYISPNQINVQAPSDTTVGTVNVVVTNNGVSSAPATAQLQTAAPAFFLYGGSSYAIGSRMPDWALIGDPTTISGTNAAKPGDIIVFWGTGFGPTTPVVAAGEAVTGVPVAVTTPTVTVGGLTAEVVSAVLTPGAVGLYQIAIKVPDAAPTGSLILSATVGGVQTPTGIRIYVSRQ